MDPVGERVFFGFPGYKPVPPGWFKIFVGFITGTPKGSPKAVFMEKPGIEPATPGLQGIALIHYTTAALWESGFVAFWDTGFVLYKNIGHWQIYMKKLLLT